jgi:hypothetical protein
MVPVANLFSPEETVIVKFEDACMFLKSNILQFTSLANVI